MKATLSFGCGKTKHTIRSYLRALGASLVLGCFLFNLSSTAFAHDQVHDKEHLYVFNWSDYIDPSVLEDFEKETGIRVHYDVMYSNEVLEAKLMEIGRAHV